MRKLMMATAMAVLMVSAAGAAHATEGWYGRVDAGFTLDGRFGIDNTDFDLDEEITPSVGLGYAFANNTRLEAEIAQRNNETTFAGNEAEVVSLMANAFYDFNRGGRFEPYVGVGAGYADFNIGGADDATWAWQAMAGVAIGLTERLDLDIGYRHFALENLEVLGADAEYDHQSATVGLRWQFAAPYVAPPPPPPPPPSPPPPPVACPASNFVVYFEWDRSNLNQQAIDVIDQAVARARQCNVSAAVVVGHTDTSGSTAYNAGLSQRRAAVVRDALVARGMAAGSITADARGETDLAQPTRDGVREPLNRRTAVTISFR